MANLSGNLDDFRVQLKRDTPRSKLKIQPNTPEEYLFKEVYAKFKYREGKTQGGTVAFPDGFLITASRLLMIVTRRDDKRGVDHFVVASADRSDFPNITTVENRKGEIKSIELSSADRSATISISFAKNGLAHVLDWLDPSSISKLDQAAADKRREQHRIENNKREEEARQAKLAKVEVAKGRFQGGGDQAPPRVSSVISTGGILDHRKTFYYRVAATPEACISAFEKAFGSGGGGLLLRAGWTLHRSVDGAIANYKGRKGLGAIGAALSQTAASEQAGAVDSKVEFQIDAEDGQYTYCSMWLTEHGSRFGFVNDGRFIKPYMRSVEAELAKLDSEVQIIKV